LLADAIVFLISVACGLFTVALLLRFYLQWARAGYRNPVSQFVTALTDFMVRPARRVIPGLWGLDLASPVLAWLIQFGALLLIAQLKGSGQDSSVLALAALAALMLAKLALYLVMIVVFVQALLSWINPYSPLAPLLNALARPFLRVFQRWIPPIGNVDLSPLLVIVACQLLLMLPVAYLEISLLRVP
jgi:YggT family protein